MRLQVLVLSLFPLFAQAARPDTSLISTCGELSAAVEATVLNLKTMRENHVGYSWLPGTAEAFFIMMLENDKCREQDDDRTVVEPGIDLVCVPYHDRCERGCDAGYLLLDRASGKIKKRYSVGQYGIDTYKACTTRLRPSSL